MDLDEDGNMIEPSIRDEHITLWNYLYRNTKCRDETVDSKLMKLGMFRSCESSLNSECDGSNETGRDSSFSSIFLWSTTIMAISDPKPKNVREVESAYTTNDHLIPLHGQLMFSSSVYEEEVMLEVCSREEMDYKASSKDSFTSSF